MKAVFKVNDRMSVELEGNEQVDIFEKVADLQEVFDNLKNPVTGSTDIRFVVRTDKDENKYYELRDMSKEGRGYRLSFGKNKKGGTLFPHRKDKDGNWLPNNGWTKWEGKKEDKTD